MLESDVSSSAPAQATCPHDLQFSVWTASGVVVSQNFESLTPSSPEEDFLTHDAINTGDTTATIYTVDEAMIGVHDFYIEVKYKENPVT